MLPVLTKYLSPEGYGIISLFTVLVSIMSVITGLSVNSGVSVNFYKYDKEKLKIFIGNCIIILNITSILVLILIFALSSVLSDLINLENVWIFIAVILAYAQFITTINLTLWLVEQKPIPYTIYQVSQTFISTSLVLFFIVYLGMDWQGQLISTTIATITFLIISFIVLYKRGYLKIKVSKEHIKDALNFGVPLIPHALSGWIKTGSDRFIISSALGVGITGIYSVSYQVGFVILVLFAAFSKAWSPYIMSELKQIPTFEKKQEIVIQTYKYFIGFIILSLGYSLFASFLIPIFFGDNFVNSSKYIIYFAIAFAFEGMYLMVVNYIFYTKSTFILSKISITSSILYVLLLYVLIRNYGIIGASISTMVVSIINFLIVWYISNKLYPMPWFNFLRKNEV